IRMLNTAAQRFPVSFQAVFIVSSRRSQSVLKLTSSTVVIGNHGSIRDSWPIAISRYPRGLQSNLRLGARGTQSRTSYLRLILVPKCPRTGLATARTAPRGGKGISADPLNRE